VYRPICAFVNVKDLPLNRGGNSVRCQTVWVDDQGVVLLLVRGERDFDEIWVCPRVLRDELLDFLHRSVNFKSRRDKYKWNVLRASQRLLVG
jgi:hypothetical protein